MTPDDRRVQRQSDIRVRSGEGLVDQPLFDQGFPGATRLLVDPQADQPFVGHGFEDLPRPVAGVGVLRPGGPYVFVGEFGRAVPERSLFVGQVEHCVIRYQ